MDLHDKISVKSIFIPPSKKELNNAISSFPENLFYLTEGTTKNIVFFSAWRPSYTTAEKDLYGILDLLQVYQKLITTFPNYYFVFMIGETNNSPFFQEIKNKMAPLLEFDNFIFLHDGISPLPLLKNTKVFLRLTKTEGDSFSIREALAFGAQIIATDVTPRPQGVHLVQLGDHKGLANTLSGILDS